MDMSYDYSEAMKALFCAGEQGMREMRSLGLATQGGDEPKRKPIKARAIEASRVDEALAERYDPEEAIREFYKPVSDYGAMWWAPLKLGAQECDPPAPHRIQVVGKFKEAGRWKTRLIEHKVRTAAQLRALGQSPEYKRSRFFESTGDWVGSNVMFTEAEYGRALPFKNVDPTAFGPGTGIEHGHFTMREGCFEFGGDPSTGSGSNVTAQMDGEYMPIMGGNWSTQLYLYAHWEMTARAFYEKNHSELAKAAISITTDFVIGTGVSWRVKNPRVNEVWREFWDRNDMTERLTRWCDDTTWQGELLVHKTERLKGYLTVRSLNPSEILEIITEVDDVENVLYYHRSAPTPYQLPYGNFKGRNINIPFSKYVIVQYPAPEVYHIKLNVSSGEKWGRSDFYSTFGTLKRDRDWYTAAVLKDILHANLIFDVAITGDQGDIDAFINDPLNDQLPGPGGTWLHNDALTLTPHHADVSSSQRAGAGNVGQALASRFATALQMPSQYFNVAAAGPARATALTQSEPHVKRIIRRQGVMQRLLDHLFEEVVICALRAGRLSRADLQHGADPEWFFPPVYEEDRGALFRDYDSMFNTRSISHRTMSTAKARQLHLDEFDYDAEQQELRREALDPIVGKIINPPQPTMMMPGQTPPGALPDNLGRNEALNGADAKARFRHDQQDAAGEAPPEVAG